MTSRAITGSVWKSMTPQNTAENRTEKRWHVNILIKALKQKTKL